MHMDIETNMRMIGKRFPYYATYTVSMDMCSLQQALNSLLPPQIGCTDEGTLNGIEATVYTDAGSSNRGSSLQAALFHIDNGRMWVYFVVEYFHRSLVLSISQKNYVKCTFIMSGNDFCK